MMMRRMMKIPRDSTNGEKNNCLFKTALFLRKFKRAEKKLLFSLLFAMI